MSYIICFWDKSKIQLPDKIGEALKTAIKANAIKNFELGENLYMVSGIEKIITKDEAFNVFPAEWEQMTRLEDRLPTKETMLALEAEHKNPAGLQRIDEIKKIQPVKDL